MAEPFAQRRSITALVESQFHDIPAFMRDELAPKPTKAQMKAVRLAFRKMKNPLGKTLISILLPVFDAGQQAELEALAERRATRFLLQRILDPAAKPPFDPFGAGPLRVDERRRVLWSVGSDGVDDGGTGPVGKKRKDIVWQLSW
jgi:hypothetical protein